LVLRLGFLLVCNSFLLSIDFKVTSITDWAAQLKINALYALLSSSQVGDTPVVGTFYDRLWNADDDNLSSHLSLSAF